MTEAERRLKRIQTKFRGGDGQSTKLEQKLSMSRVSQGIIRKSQCACVCVAGMVLMKARCMCQSVSPLRWVDALANTRAELRTPNSLCCQLQASSLNEQQIIDQDFTILPLLALKRK